MLVVIIHCSICKYKTALHSFLHFIWSVNSVTCFFEWSSERVSKTGASGILLTEAKFINESLHHLEKVICFLLIFTFAKCLHNLLIVVRLTGRSHRCFDNRKEIVNYAFICMYWVSLFSTLNNYLSLKSLWSRLQLRYFAEEGNHLIYIHDAFFAYS